MRAPLSFQFGRYLKEKPAAASAGQSLPARGHCGQTRSGGASSAKQKYLPVARAALPLAHRRGRG
eukprot:999611-Pyramimonas_sp.AAC.1